MINGLLVSFFCVPQGLNKKAPEKRNNRSRKEGRKDGHGSDVDHAG